MRSNNLIFSLVVLRYRRRASNPAFGRKIAPNPILIPANRPVAGKNVTTPPLGGKRIADAIEWAHFLRSITVDIRLRNREHRVRVPWDERFLHIAGVCLHHHSLQWNECCFKHTRPSYVFGFVHRVRHIHIHPKYVGINIWREHIGFT